MAKDLIKLLLHLCKNFHSDWSMKFKVENKTSAPGCFNKIQILPMVSTGSVQVHTSNADVFYSLRCSDLRCSASFLRRHTLGLESKSEEGWQEAALQNRFSTTDQSLLGIYSSLYCQSEFVILQIGLPPSVPALDLSVSPPFCRRKQNIWSSLTSSSPQVAPRCSELLKATQRKVPVTLSHILTWELS